MEEKEEEKKIVIDFSRTIFANTQLQMCKQVVGFVFDFRIVFDFSLKP